MTDLCELDHICQRTSREYCQKAMIVSCSKPEYDPKVKENFEKTLQRCGRLGLWKRLNEKETQKEKGNETKHL